jgi:hypothetical protein
MFHSSIGKSVMNAQRLCELSKDCSTVIGQWPWRNGGNKTPPFLHFPIAKGRTRTIAHLPIVQ